VLGGTGLSGPFLVRRLDELGHQVTVFHRGRHEADLPAGVRRIHGTLEDPPEELRRLAPDVVVHMWAMTERDAKLFLALFRGGGGRAVVVSSGDVYRAYGRLQRLESGPPDRTPIAEDGPLRESRYPYAGQATDENSWMRQYDKILVEQALLAQAELPVTILRYPAVHGPGDSYHRFRGWLRQMEAQRDIGVQDTYGRWRWTHGYVENVAEAAALAATDRRAGSRVYNVGEAETPSMAERLEELGRAIGWGGRVLAVPVDELPPEQRMPLDFAHDLVMDSSRIRRELGFRERVSRAAGLERTIEWERNSS
jgi:nucleoside-diphosphate-sugar epimerase